MLRAVECLSGNDGQSRSTEILAEGVKTVTIPIIARKLQSIDDCITASQLHGLKRLEVELRLYKAAGALVLDKAGIVAPLEAAVQNLHVAQDLCDQYHLTAGLFTKVCKSISKILTDEKVKFNYRSTTPTDHPIFFGLTEQHWWQWPKYQTGALTSCEHGHPYSSTNRQHCPECGPILKSEEEREHDRMKEAEFQAKLVQDPDQYVAAAKQWAVDRADTYGKKKVNSRVNSPTSSLPLPNCENGHPLDPHALDSCPECEAIKEVDAVLERERDRQDQVRQAAEKAEADGKQEEAERHAKILTPDAQQVAIAAQQWALKIAENNRSNTSSPKTIKCDNGHVLQHNDWSPCSECEAQTAAETERQELAEAERKQKSEEEATQAAEEAEQKEKQQNALRHAILNPDHDDVMAASQRSFAQFAAKYARSKGPTSQVSVN